MKYEMNNLTLQLIDELNTYDLPARGAGEQLWRLSETEFEYKYFLSNGFGIDAATTMEVRGTTLFMLITTRWRFM